jgi:two-component system sensor histidine kinase PilS (NtrC family)
MRTTSTYPDRATPHLPAPAQILRGLWLGRLTLGGAILVAAVFAWGQARPEDTLVATLTFATALLSTVASALWVEIYRRPAGRAFLLGQLALDLLLVTAVVHITGGWNSQFAALYILVIALASLLVPVRDALGVAGASCVLYAIDVLGLRGPVPHLTVWVQLAVFVLVAVGSALIAGRLREAGATRDALAAQLAKVRLEAADILRSIPSGILTVDTHGRLLYANPTALALLGLPSEPRVGDPVLSALVSAAPELATELGRAVRDALPRSRAEGVIHRVDGSVPVGLTTTYTDGDGVGRTATVIFQDITDSKRLQALHIRTERLQAVAELSASLAHEIKNPLASIRSATEQLARRQDSRPETDEDARALCALTIREADRLSRLLTEFLDFARTRAPRLAPVRVDAVVRTAAAMVGHHPDCAPGVQLTIEADTAGDELVVAGDEDLLHRAVANLLLNAVQAVGRAGQVRVSVSCSTDEGAGDGTVHVRVEDDGPGIAADLRDRIFEPFVTGKPGGTGLGLAVVHRAVEAHGGTVQVEPRARGACFTLHLPRVPVAGRSAGIPAGAVPRETDERAASPRTVASPLPPAVTLPAAA